MSRPIFPVIPRKTPILDLLRAQKVGTTPETLTEAQKRLMEEFRRGIASALGVPPEAIREEPLQKWIIEWSKAFTKPEYWAEGYELGRQLGEIIRSSGAYGQALPPRGTGLITGRAGERRGGQPRIEEEREERHFKEEGKLYSEFAVER
jgi:hypothetical protein